MPNKLIATVIPSLFFLVILGCHFTEVSPSEMSTETVRVLIIGSAEHPDPVLDMVRELEEQGMLENVIVRESFPVQIDVTGPANLIKKIQALPKKKSPSFQ